ncbi:unnamed protein product, partial [Ranitomeya imitator]
NSHHIRFSYPRSCWSVWYRGDRLVPDHLREARGVAVLCTQDQTQNGSIILYNRKKVKYRKEWLLLEEAQGRQDHPRGSHEAEGAGHGVPVWLLCALLHRPDISPPLLLAPAEPGHRPRSLPECPGHRGLREDLRPHPLLHQQRPQGVDEVEQGGADQPAEAHV